MITSFRNPLVRRIKRLHRKKHRILEGSFYVEGLRVVLAAIEAGAPIEIIVYASDLLTSDVAWAALSQQQATGLNCVEFSAPVFQSISDRDHPTGLGAIVECNWMELRDMSVGERDILVALIGVNEPGNLGTIIRTIDAVGGAGLLLIGRTVDPFHPTAVKASMGAVFSIPIYSVPDTETLLDWAKGHSLHTIATSARADIAYQEGDYQTPALLMLGSEGEGLPTRVLEVAHQSVSIPMAGSASSLNLSVAAGVLLFEIQRQVRS